MSPKRSRFFSPYSHGFVRAAVCVPDVRVASTRFNLERTLELAGEVTAGGAAIAVFPELGLSSYSCEDLFHQRALLDAVDDALRQLVEASDGFSSLLFVGAPLLSNGRLFNCAVAIYRGKILGVTPKSYLPNYREFYEKRQFAAARHAVEDTIRIGGHEVPFGTELLYVADNIPGFVVHAEICEDVWAPTPPSTTAALAGATVLVNLSASNVTIGKAEYRRSLCASQSAKCAAAYLYSAAGPGESTTDLAWDGHGIIYENGSPLAESQRFPEAEEIVFADVDIDRLIQERMRWTSFHDAAAEAGESVRRCRRIPFEFSVPDGDLGFERRVNPFPYVPTDEKRRGERCREAYQIQVHGLIKRLSSAGIRKVVIGVSGGLDSTHALIVACKAMDRLGLPRENVLAYTMPGFATGDETLANAHDLMQSLGVSAEELDIRPSCEQMLKDIGHPYAEGEKVYDVTFENVQAGERTSHLFRLANHHGAIVLGTGDLSELALGWCTYGVGDHMSHYNVNASVPKTLIRHLIRWVAESGEGGGEVGPVLLKVLETAISPELVPAEDGKVQDTEAAIGPYELQDFNLYYTTRFGLLPSKVAFLSYHAWSETYDIASVKAWLRTFLYRFFQTSQFKRSCVPNGPKVGSGGSLSPRGDWRAPSDSEATVWLDELEENVPDA